MVYIQLRRGSTIPANELHQVGEPVWDDANSRFGVFNNRAPTAMEWYPVVIGNKMLMNPLQTLGGKINAGDENTVYLDWSTQDMLYIRNRQSGAVYATFAAGGATFNALAAIGTSYVGAVNMLLNGNLSCQSDYYSGTSFVPDTSVVGFKATMVAPNWMLWKTANTGGRLVVAHELAQAPMYPGAPNAIVVATTGAPNSSGLRIFAHGYEAFRSVPMTFSVYMLGSLGSVITQRARSENGNTLFTKQVTGTGAVQRIVTTFTPPNDGSRWAGIDVLYNPGQGDVSTKSWKVGGAQLQFGTSASPVELRNEGMERALLQSIYFEGMSRLDGAADSRIIPFNNFRYGAGLMAREAAGKVVNVTGVSPFGASIQVPSLTAASTVRYAAYMMPTNAETA